MPTLTGRKERRDTSLRFDIGNPVLGLGVFGVEIDTLRFKIGDGRTAWRDLPYATGDITDAVTKEQVEDMIADSHEEMTASEIDGIWEEINK